MEKGEREMKNFVFYQPHSLQELLESLHTEKRKYQLISGGTDLLVKLKEGILETDIVYDISQLPELNFLEEKDDYIYIGAAICVGDLIGSELIKEKLPLLWEAISQIGSLQIRNRATLGGNFANASPAGDSIPALVAYDGIVDIVSKNSQREVEAVKFFTGPGKTILEKGEIIRGFKVPISRIEGENVFFAKIGSRKAVTISKASFALRIKLDDKRVSFFKIAFGSVGPTVRVGEKIAAFITGKILSSEVIKKALTYLPEDISPIDDYRSTASYRKDVLKNLLEAKLYSLIEK
jgi:xanthine dehydrogenase FAD-binding subunit